jgi:peroxiredoxin
MNYRRLSIFVFALLLMSSQIMNAADITKAENFTLKDYNGKEHNLKDFKDSKAIVIMFIATRCPVSNSYNERMEKLYEKYSGKNVTFLGINSNKEEDSEEIKKHASEKGLDFTILKDPGNKVADEFGASHTPEIFVLNSDNEVLYHGRIDDSMDKKEVTSNDLENALDEILSGEKVAVSQTKAFGCSIKRVE